MQEKIPPMRRCVACMEMKPKAVLLRVTRSPQGVVAVDGTGKSPGRGAYLCAAATCVEKAAKGKKLDRALKSPVPPEVYDTLRGAVRDGG